MDPEHVMPLERIRGAAERHGGHVHVTPILGSRTAASVVAEAMGVRLGSGPPGDGRARVLLKAEHLQVTGAFKPRGAVNKVRSLQPGEAAGGLITLSAGNHAQALAYAAASAGLPVTVVMPANASHAKAEAARGYGARIELHGHDVGETFQRMEQLRDERGLLFVHPYDDPDIIAGQGTVGLEIVAEVPDVDVVVAGVGGGGLLSGVASAVRQLRPSARIYGVEPETSDAMARALAAGHPVPVRPQSIADGLGAPFAGAWTMDLVRTHAEPIVLVDDGVIARGMRFALERMKQLLEPAGAAALGALLAGRIPVRDGETVCVVASGGNVDLARVPELLAMAEG